MITDTYLESYNNLLLLDDDDGNPSTPSPHRCLINEAFAKRGLASELNCEDKKHSLPQVDSDLNLGIYDIDSNRVSLVGSAEKKVDLASVLAIASSAFMEGVPNLNCHTSLPTKSVIFMHTKDL